MSNQLQHNKWHGFNHHTQPTVGFPDSSTDPIASFNYPFKGIFYNIIETPTLTLGRATITSTGSGYTTAPELLLSARGNRGKVLKQGKFKANLNTILKTITSVDVLDGGNYTGSVFLAIFPIAEDFIYKTAIFTLSSIQFNFGSNSSDWGFYSTLTKNNSSDWNLWYSVRDTVTSLSAYWELGYEGFTTLTANSANFDSVFNSTKTLSSENQYDGLGGTGWHIALSSITHNLNTSAINIRQKAAVPVRLYEEDKTLTWNTTAQIVYYNVTENYELTANNVLEAKKGGKYTMWLYIDRCPREYANVVFDLAKYNILVKTPEETFSSVTEVLTLSARHITRIDFVYDGDRMLGRATDYFIDLPTTFDTYYKGTGITFYNKQNRKKNPVNVNGIEEPFDYLTNGRGILEMQKVNLTLLPSSSSQYIAGTGIKMRFLGADQQYFSFNLYNAQWPSTNYLTKFPSSTASFDRVIGLSGGSWLDPAYGNNLIVTPVSGDVPAKIIQKFPEPNYYLGSSNLITFKQCTSSYVLEIYSGKDRIIDNITLNGVSIVKTPVLYNGFLQPFNFLNEETATLKFERIQEDQDIEVYYNTQPVLRVPNNVLWFNSMDDNLFKPSTSNVDEWSSNTINTNYKLIQYNAGSRPALTTSGSLRGVYLKNNNYLTLNSALTSLSSEKLFRVPFSTITVLEFDSLPATSVIWWLGDFSYSGYGLVMRGNRMYTRSGTVPFDLVDKFIFETGKKYVITTVFDGRYEKILVNNRIATYRSKKEVNQLKSNQISVYSDYNFIFGKNPDGASGYSDLKMYEFALFKKALTTPEVNRLNQFYIEKINGYK